MGRGIDLTGQQFGKLTVIQRAPNKPNDAHIQWLCKCDCGNEIIYSSKVLRSGRAKSCGCLRKEDLTGRVFGRLTVLEYAYSNNGRRYWNCQCSCGNTITVATKSLTTGNTRSCGCLRRDTIININMFIKSNVNRNEIIGKQIDYLEVLSVAPSRNGLSYYLCKCHHCGNLKEVKYSDLVSGKVHACGCLQSHGEQQLKDYLSLNNISFIPQYKFKDLLSDKNYPLRFDFGVFNQENNLVCLIEYQGQQHSDRNNPWFSDTLHKHDLMKKEYCKNHNIALLYCNKDTNIKEFVKEVVLPMATIGV